MKKEKVRKHFSYYAINSITFYRLVATILLLVLILNKEFVLFKWFLAFSFFTDTIDGFLARQFKVVSVLGSRMDSVADDLTVVMALAGVYVFKNDFLMQNLNFFLFLLVLYVIQVGNALLRYHKFTSFHTWSAKFSFLLQGIFLILVFFLNQPPMWLFYAAVVFTAIQLIEETIMVWLLPKWQADVKGIYEVMKGKIQRKKG